LHGASKSYGDKVIFPPFDLEFTKGEKIAIVGPNGAGKSTFCKLITDELEPSAGSIELGGKVLPSFFSQNHADELDPTKTVLETVEEVATREAAASARNILGCFLFRGDDVFKKVGILSGGERSRVALVRAERTIEFQPAQKPTIYHGNLSYYLDKKEEQKAAATATKSATSGNGKNTPKASGGNRKEQRKREAEQRRIRKDKLEPLERQLETTEGQISEIEAAQATLTEHMNTPEVAADGKKMQEATIAYSALAEKLEKAYSDWSIISEKIETVTAELED